MDFQGAKEIEASLGHLVLWDNREMTELLDFPALLDPLVRLALLVFLVQKESKEKMLL
jgi:hypothetical protein